MLPTLETGRLILRPLALDDAPRVRALAGDRAVAATTLMIPHPYPEGAAEEWIGGHDAAFAEGKEATFGIVRRQEGDLIGAIGLTFCREHHRAEMGYWIGRPFWNQGYATEAAAAVLDYAFRVQRLRRVVAHHMTSNPASGRVLEKIGMRLEGEMREHVLKWGEYEDVRWYGIMGWEYDGGKATERRSDERAGANERASE